MKKWKSFKNRENTEQTREAGNIHRKREVSAKTGGLESLYYSVALLDVVSVVSQVSVPGYLFLVTH